MVPRFFFFQNYDVFIGRSDVTDTSMLANFRGRMGFEFMPDDTQSTVWISDFFFVDNNNQMCSFEAMSQRPVFLHGAVQSWGGRGESVTVGNIHIIKWWVPTIYLCCFFRYDAFFSKYFLSYSLWSTSSQKSASHRVDEGQGGELIPSECYSRSVYGHPRAAFQKKSDTAGQVECPPCPEFLENVFQANF